jgi:hypothetical protein
MSSDKSFSQMSHRKVTDKVDERFNNISVLIDSTPTASSHSASIIRVAEEDTDHLSARIAASNVHTQLQSPLFAMLHPELRNIVFALALTEYDDLAWPYAKHETYYRSGFEFARRIDTNLLLTCRLVYLETHLAPISLNEHVLWMTERGPLWRSFHPHDYNVYFARMTPQQRAAVRLVRVFDDTFWMEEVQQGSGELAAAVPKLAIAIRHFDWWFWERGEPIRIRPPREGWDAWVGSIAGMEGIELEFEKIEQLDNGASLIREAPAMSMWVGTLCLRVDRKVH